MRVSIGPDGGSGSRMIGSPLRPMSPEKTSRWLPPSVIRRSDRRGAEDVAGLDELEREMLPEVGDAAVGHADHQLLHRDRVGQVVERLALRPGLAAALEVLVVLLLDVRRVRQHHRAQVAGGGRGVDRPVEAVAHQQRQPPGVVDVGVAQHDAVEPARVERQPRVQLVGLRRAGPGTARRRAGTAPPAASSRCIEPVTWPAAPQNVRRIPVTCRSGIEVSAQRWRVPNSRSPASPRPGRM